MYYVYSTITCDTAYPLYIENSSKDLGIIKKDSDGKPLTVIIKGGHGVSTKHMYTPRGVVTKVSDAEMELLEANVNFQRHKKAGFITVDKKEVDPAKVVDDMKEKDGSAPLTPKDYEESEQSTAETKVYKKKGSEK